MTDDAKDSSDVLIIRGPDGRFLPGTRPGNLITRENAPDLLRKRREKMRDRLRARIREETAGLSRLPLNSSADAVAEAAAMLWHDVVLNPDAFPRDRLEAFWKIGQLLELVPAAGSQQPAAEAASDRDALAGLAREHLLAFVEERQRQRAAAAGDSD